MLRDRVAEWLDSQDDVTDVRPVQVRLHSMTWHGASFIRGGEKVYYLVGKRVAHREPTCYWVDTWDSEYSADLCYDWYVGGYVDRSPNEKTEEHPFGNHLILVPWIIEGDPDSQIDDYADEEYKRATLTVKEYPR